MSNFDGVIFPGSRVVSRGVHHILWTKWLATDSSTSCHETDSLDIRDVLWHSGEESVAPNSLIISSLLP